MKPLNVIATRHPIYMFFFYFYDNNKLINCTKDEENEHVTYIKIIYVSHCFLFFLFFSFRVLCLSFSKNDVKHLKWIKNEFILNFQQLWKKKNKCKLKIPIIIKTSKRKRKKKWKNIKTYCKCFDFDVKCEKLVQNNSSNIHFSSSSFISI